MESEFPVVIKPVDSSGSCGFHICENDEDLRKAYNDLHTTNNVFGLPQNNMIIQQFMKGTEYVVDCVSKNGSH